MIDVTRSEDVPVAMDAVPEGLKFTESEGADVATDVSVLEDIPPEVPTSGTVAVFDTA